MGPTSFSMPVALMTILGVPSPVDVARLDPSGQFLEPFLGHLW